MYGIEWETIRYIEPGTKWLAVRQYGPITDEDAKQLLNMPKTRRGFSYKLGEPINEPAEDDEWAVVDIYLSHGRNYMEYADRKDISINKPPKRWWVWSTRCPSCGTQYKYVQNEDLRQPPEDRRCVHCKERTYKIENAARDARRKLSLAPKQIVKHEAYMQQIDINNMSDEEAIALWSAVREALYE